MRRVVAVHRTLWLKGTCGCGVRICHGVEGRANLSVGRCHFGQDALEGPHQLQESNCAGSLSGVSRGHWKDSQPAILTK